MDIDDAITGGVEVAEHAITEVARSESNWAAVILVIVVIGTLALVAWVVFWFMRERVDRANQRLEEEKQKTNEEKASAEERMEALLLQHERELHCRDMLINRYDDTMSKVNTTLGGVNEAWKQGNDLNRQSNEIHSDTRKSLDRNSELLERILSGDMKSSAQATRKKAGGDEQTNLRNP